MISNRIEQKYEKLLEILTASGGAAIAFSGGVDSTFLLYAAQKTLKEKVLAITVSTPFIPRWEGKEAALFASQLQVKHLVHNMPFPEELRHNPPDHCYTCKKILFGKMFETAQEHGICHVFDGTNIDDLSDYRPGLKALKELNIRSPLMESGLTKDDIRQLSRKYDLPTWNKPSFACLLSRMTIGSRVDEKVLQRVELAEVFLMNVGFPAVRVRNHGDLARIEVPGDRLHELIEANTIHGIESKLKELGYRHVSVDISGYTMGSLNPESA